MDNPVSAIGSRGGDRAPQAPVPQLPVSTGTGAKDEGEHANHNLEAGNLEHANHNLEADNLEAGNLELVED